MPYPFRVVFSPGGGNGNPFSCSCVGNLMDKGAYGATVHWPWVKHLLGVAAVMKWQRDIGTAGTALWGEKSELGLLDPPS